MPTPTYTPLANITLGSAAAIVTFGSIPATYRDLICIVTAKGSVSLQSRITLNSDTGSNYNYQRMSGNGSFAGAVSAVNQTRGFLSAQSGPTSFDITQISINIMDYSATDKHKTIISRADAAALATEAFVNRWASTAAVTSVQIRTSTGNWAAESTFALYGVIA
jgi:hypothetical protein